MPPPTNKVPGTVAQAAGGKASPMAPAAGVAAATPADQPAIPPIVPPVAFASARPGLSPPTIVS